MPVRSLDPASTALDHTRAATRRRWSSLLGLIVLMGLSGAALGRFGGTPRAPEAGPSLDVLRAVLTGSTLPLEPIVDLLVGGAWLLWLWIVLSLVLELLLLALETLARGAGWLRSLRGVTDRFTAPIVRRAVAAAFAVQILSRSVPVAAAEPLQQPDVNLVVQHTASANPPAVSARPMAQSNREPRELAVYRVRTGDTLWTIAQKAYGSGTEYRRVVQANLGRRMPDGQTFTARGVIESGWELVLPELTADVDEVDGERWYTVQPGDTLCGIAARLLHDQHNWRVLLELNYGATSPDRAHVLTNPNLIWPGLRLRLPDQQAAATDADSPDAATSAASHIVTHAPQASPDTTAEERSLSVGASAAHAETELSAATSPNIVSAIIPPAEPEPAPLLRTIHPLPPVAMDDSADPSPGRSDVPEPTTVGAQSEDRPVVPIAAGAAALAIAATAGAVAFRRRHRRLRPLTREPESDIVVKGGYAAAELTHDFTRGLQGGGLDPVAAVASQVRAFLREYNLEQVGLVSVRHGRSSTGLTLSPGVSEQRLLVDLAPEIGARLGVQAEAHVTSDEDVLLRLVRVPKSRLLPAAEAEPSLDDLCVPLGALPDHQILSGAWPALGNLLIASHTGHGADVILTSLLATLAARCSPDQLQVWLVAEPRALPGPVADMPHVARTVDPSNAVALDALLEDLRHELDRRAAGSEEDSELVVAIAELTRLGERCAELELLMPQAVALGVRFIAASSSPGEAVQLPVLTQFSTRMVLHMEDEALSVGLLGVADAAFLGGGGRLLLRIDNREPVELFGFQVTAEHLERLVRVMRSAYASGAPPVRHVEQPKAPTESPPRIEQPEPAVERPGAPVEAPETPVTQAELAVAAPRLQVFCFGGPRVLYNERQVWPGHPAGDIKPWEFLLYLACQPREGVARDEAVAALWPDDEVDDPAHRIRQLRYRLRTLFGEKKGGSRDDGIAGGVRLRLDPGVIYSDAQEFLDLVRSKRTTPSPPDVMIARLERARALYTGDLLDGPDVRRYAWAEDRDDSGVTLREHFRRLYHSATLSLADLYAASDQLAAAIETYREVTELDPGDERVWLALFRIHARRGDRPALLREERRMRSALRQLAGDADGKVTAGMDEPSRNTTQEFQRLLAELDATERQTAAV
jgi:DNA-binding SARP family transcriptional activator